MYIECCAHIQNGTVTELIFVQGRKVRDSHSKWKRDTQRNWIKVGWNFLIRVYKQISYFFHSWMAQNWIRLFFATFPLTHFDLSSKFLKRLQFNLLFSSELMFGSSFSLSGRLIDRNHFVVILFPFCSIKLPRYFNVLIAINVDKGNAVTKKKERTDLP